MSEEKTLEVKAISISSELEKLIEESHNSELEIIRSIYKERDLYSGTGIIENKLNRLVVDI